MLDKREGLRYCLGFGLAPKDPFACMRIHRPGILQAFWSLHPDAEALLRAWFHDAKSSAWSTFAELKARHQGATILKDGRVTFDICEAKYRLVVRIDFAAGIIVISTIGAHPEYRSPRQRGLDDQN
jgi:mRNA interferase HigB